MGRLRRKIANEPVDGTTAGNDQMGQLPDKEPFTDNPTSQARSCGVASNRLSRQAYR